MVKEASRLDLSSPTSSGERVPLCCGPAPSRSLSSGAVAFQSSPTGRSFEQVGRAVAGVPVRPPAV